MIINNKRISQLILLTLFIGGTVQSANATEQNRSITQPRMSQLIELKKVTDESSPYIDKFMPYYKDLEENGDHRNMPVLEIQEQNDNADLFLGLLQKQVNLIEHESVSIAGVKGLQKVLEALPQFGINQESLKNLSPFEAKKKMISISKPLTSHFRKLASQKAEAIRIAITSATNCINCLNTEISETISQSNTDFQTTLNTLSTAIGKVGQNGESGKKLSDLKKGIEDLKNAIATKEQTAEETNSRQQNDLTQTREELYQAQNDLSQTREELSQAQNDINNTMENLYISCKTLSSLGLGGRLILDEFMRHDKPRKEDNYKLFITKFWEWCSAQNRPMPSDNESASYTEEEINTLQNDFRDYISELNHEPTDNEIEGKLLEMFPK